MGRMFDVRSTIAHLPNIEHSTSNIEMVLCLVAVQGGRLSRASLEVLTRARQTAHARGVPLAAVVLAPDAAAHADEAARYGAQTVYAVSHPVFTAPVNAPVVEALAAVIGQAQPGLVLLPSSEGVKDVLGALAARLDAPAIPDAVRFTWEGGAVEAVRPVMAAKFLARVRAEGSPVLVSVRGGAVAPEEAPAEARVEAVSFDFDEVDLSEASVVVAAGRGVRDEAAKALVEELAAVTGGAIGASRAVVESGMFPATAQIGQTGKVVAPDVYFAVGLSGAIQHYAGMSGSRVIVAINKDPDAPIMKVATYALAGDLYRILPALIAEIRRVKGG
jgi:electron transfer flavoprotein alpha subunit